VVIVAPVADPDTLAASGLFSTGDLFAVAGLSARDICLSLDRDDPNEPGEP
jgi:hypothetical protein